MTEATEALTPTGRLRGALNFGNHLLALPGEPPTGLTVEMAHELAAALGVEVAFTGYDKAADVFEAAGRDVWDICFLANDPVRAARLAFTRPYVALEGCFLVRSDAPARSASEVIAQGLPIATARGSAYSLGLMRVAEAGQIRVYDDGAAARAAFERGEADSLAGIRQRLEEMASAQPEGLRVLEPPFVEIRQAIGTATGRPAAARFLDTWLEGLITSGRLAAMAAPWGLAEAIPDGVGAR